MATRACCTLFTVPVPGRKAYVLSGGETAQPAATRADVTSDSLSNFMGILRASEGARSVPRRRRHVACSNSSAHETASPGDVRAAAADSAPCLPGVRLVSGGAGLRHVPQLRAARLPD